MEKRSESRIELPHTIAGRVGLAIVCAPMLAFSGWGAWTFVTNLRLAASLFDALASAVVAQFVFSLLAVSMLGLVWAAVTPDWLRTLVDRHVVRLGVATLVLVPLLFAAVWVFG